MVSNVDCLGSTSCILPQPTNNPKQLKTTFVGVVLLLVKKKATPPHHQHPGCDYNLPSILYATLF